MAIIRNTASMMLRGRVGSTTYYVAESRQLARQAMNNSNYGENASRTDLQQSRRVKWANLVNFYSANKAWMKKAYEELKPGVSIFNRFMQLNLASANIALTKNEAQAKLWVASPYRVTQGSLQPLEFSYEGEMAVLSLSSAGQITNETTVAEYSQAFINNNAGYQNGDAIICVSFWGVSGIPGETEGMNPAKYRYSEFVLDTEDTATMASRFPDWGVVGNAVAASSSDGSQAAVYIHTRKSGGKLYVSTQDIVLSVPAQANASEWETSTQLAKAILSYGETTSVPLAPGGQGSLSSGNDSSTGGGDDSGNIGE